MKNFQDLVGIVVVFLALACAIALLLAIVVPSPGRGAVLPGCWEPRHDGKAVPGVGSTRHKGECYRLVYGSVMAVCEQYGGEARLDCWEREIPLVGCVAVVCGEKV